MPNQTPNYNLTKPDLEEFYSVDVQNDNMDIIDTALKNLDESKATSANLTALEQKITDHSIQTTDDGVHGLATTQDITLYVNPNGSDTNDGLTVENALKTVQAAVNKLPKVINHNVVIEIAPGTYNESLTLKGFMGGGTLSLLGDTTVSDSRILNNIVVNRTQVPVVIRGLNQQASNAHGIDVQYSKAVIIQFIKSISTTSTYHGVNSINSNIRIYGSFISNKNSAIYAGINSSINSEGNTGNGNAFSLVAYTGSTIGKIGTQPTGDESTLGGMIIPSKINWIVGTLLNGWTGTLRYFKNDVGIVFIEINAYGTVVAKDTIISVLPIGYRPIQPFPVPLITDTTNIINSGLYIDTGGNIRLGSSLTQGVYHSTLCVFPA